MSAGHRLNLLHQEQIGESRKQCFDNVVSTLDCSVSLSSEDLPEHTLQLLFEDQVPTNKSRQQYSFGNQVDLEESQFFCKTDCCSFNKSFEE